MNKLAKYSCVVGSLLLGFSAVLLSKQPRPQGRPADSRLRRKVSRARRSQQPVEELAQPLQQAWGAYHNR